MHMISTSTVAEATSAVWLWFSTHGVTILAIVAGAFFAFIVEKPIVEYIIRRAVRLKDPDEERLRENTLIRITHSVIRITIWIIAGLMILQEVGINIAPLLAAAGVVGIAVGFGGQYLIRDIVAGFFIIVENQYRVGDVVSLDQTSGLVEDISIRAATLRDLDGTVHHVQHGNVTRVSNLSKEYARINLNVGVSYSSDLEKVIQCINRVGQEMADDPAWKWRIRQAPHFERVDDFGDWAIVVKILGETKTLQQWAATGELRKRLKIAFDKEGIEIPFPQQVIHQSK
jgi:small-conductance mechanosensitive channel